MQALVYTFITLAGVAVAAAAYFGLTFTPIEAVLTGLVAICLCIVLLERTLRRRAEARLERGIQDLSRLLSTDAQAGQVLSQRVNELADVEAGSRLDSVEAYVSVLGTVVQQVAEAVADIEDKQDRMLAASSAPGVGAETEIEDDRIYADAPQRSMLVGHEDLPAAEMVRSALEEGRVSFHIQPVVTLPQRRICAYDLMPRVELENGEFVSAIEFTPRKGGDGLVRKIEQLGWEKAVSIARHARAAGEQVTINTPISRATLADPAAVEAIVDRLDQSRAMAKDIGFLVSERQWKGSNAMERHGLSSLVEKGAGISILDARDLRMDFAELEAFGITSVRADATRFINQPDSFTDFHSSDVAAYIARYGLDFIITGIRSEQQILSLLDDGVRFAQGNHIARPGPVPADLTAGLTNGAQPKRAGASN